MGNSESSSQLPAGTDGRRGVGRGNKSEEENDATSSTSIGTAVKVGAAVAGTALAAWGAWNMATSSSSEHTEDDRRRNALGAAQEQAVLEYDGAGRNSGGGRGLIPNEDYCYQPALAAWGAWNMATSSSSEHPEDDRRRNALGAAQEQAVLEYDGAGRNGRGGGSFTPNEDYYYQPALAAWGAWNMATSSSSEHPEDDRRRNALGAAQEQAVLEYDGAGRNGRGGGSFTPNEVYYYQQEKNYHASRTIKFMTYNVWKQEGSDCFGRELRERIQAIGRLVENHDPDLIFFQEVTPNIYQIFQSFDWWENYVCSDLPQKAPEGDFCIVLSKLHLRIIIRGSYESSEGREFPTCKLDAGFGTSLLVANGHLIRPNYPVKVNSEKRKKQAKAAMDFLDNSSNAVFGGDMNWNEDKDGSFPLPEAWDDAWTVLKGSDNGWTYDTQSNNNLKDHITLQKRLDRFVCKLSDFELLDIKLIGKGPKPPSDHYGLLLTIRYE